MAHNRFIVYPSSFITLLSGHRFNPTPTNAARPIPDNENSPHVNTAPPMPIVKDQRNNYDIACPGSSQAIIDQIGNSRHKQSYRKRSSMIPPNTAEGIDFSKALTLPITENRIAVTAAIRIT